MQTTTTETAASSAAPQTFEIPSDPKANLEWRKTGEVPAASSKQTTPKEDSTPSNKKASASASEESAAETAAASATALKQEKAKQPRADDRLNELLADLKKAGLTPAELKTFKREAAAAAKTATAPANAAPEKTANPQGPVEPVEPTQKDTKADGTPKYATWEEFDADHRKYVRDYAQYVAKMAVAEDRQARAAEAQQQTLAQKVTEAKARYGDQTEATIGNATRAIMAEAEIPVAVRALIDGSTVLVDVMYALGSDQAELDAFVDLAKRDPAAAIRKFVLLEHLTTEELTKSAAAGKGTAAAEGAGAERDENGKFVSHETTPAKKRPAAPPPPEELNTRGSAPPDEIADAIRRAETGDVNATRVAIDALNRRDIARRRGA